MPNSIFFTINDKRMVNEFTTSSLLRHKIEKSFSFSTLFLKTLKCEKTLFLCSKKNHVNIEKSLTKTKTNQFSLRLLVLVRPNKSMCISFKGRDVMISLIDLKEDLVCFSGWHASQM